MSVAQNSFNYRAPRGASLRADRTASFWLLVVMPVLAAAWPAFAQSPPEGPTARDCGSITREPNESKADWINRRIDCRHENLHAQVFELVDQVDKDDVLSNRQKEYVRNARQRAENSRKRSKEAGSFKGLGRKEKVECTIVEYDQPLNPDGSRAPGDDGNNDGVCITQGMGRENCLEVNSDQIGDDDGICERHGNVKEECVKNCEQEQIDAEDGNFDEAATEDFEEALADAENAVRETNKQIAVSMKLKALARQTVVAADDSKNDCKQLLMETRDLDLFLAVAAKSMIISASGVYDICDSICNLDVLGNNVSPACAVAVPFKMIAETVDAAYQLADGDITTMRFDASMACLQQMDLALKDTQSKVGESNEKIDELSAKVDALDARFDEVVGLLNTPQGRRTDFPQKP